MKILICLILLSGLGLANAQVSRGAQVRVPIAITNYQFTGEEHRLSVEVIGATRSSQVVVLVRRVGQSGIRPAVGRDGEPERPETEDKLPPSNSSIPPIKSKWTLSFRAIQNEGRVSEIFAIVCEIKLRDDWSHSRDYRGFKYLPFSKVDDIDSALAILRDFGWIPIGLTRIEP